MRVRYDRYDTPRMHAGLKRCKWVGVNAKEVVRGTEARVQGCLACEIFVPIPQA